MQQNLIILASVLAHYGRAYLAKPYSMPPARAGDDETRWNIAFNVNPVYHERAAVKMGLTERAAYLKLLAYDKRTLRPDYLQFPYAAAPPTLKRHQVNNPPQVKLQLVFNQSRKLFLSVLNTPSVKV